MSSKIFKNSLKILTIVILVLIFQILIAGILYNKVFKKEVNDLLKNYLEKTYFKAELEKLKENEILLNNSFSINELENSAYKFGLRFFLYEDKNIEIFEEKFNIKKYTTFQLINGTSQTAGGKGTSYLEFYDNKLFLATASGMIAFTEKISGEEINLKAIESNFKQFFNYEEFKKVDDISVKDLLITDQNIYVSYVAEKEPNCFNTSIVKADLNYNFLKFEYFFSPSECVHIDKTHIYNEDKKIIETEFNAAQSGGRMLEYKKEFILLSTGEFRQRHLAQSKDSIFGKILQINKKSKKVKIVSMGHRNPQGLYYDKNNSFIISTEHGPKGGDEINLISKLDKFEQNYGWPISSYGEHYTIKLGKNHMINKYKYKKYPLYKSHKDKGFIEPLKYFKQSIGISQIIKKKGFDNDNNEEHKFLFTSLKNKRLYLIQLDKNFNLKNKDKIEAGSFDMKERVRDIIYIDKDLETYALFLENEPSLAIIRKKEQ